jgi:hypothetical protein
MFQEALRYNPNSHPLWRLYVLSTDGVYPRLQICLQAIKTLASNALGNAFLSISWKFIGFFFCPRTDIVVQPTPASPASFWTSSCSCSQSRPTLAIPARLSRASTPSCCLSRAPWESTSVISRFCVFPVKFLLPHSSNHRMHHPNVFPFPPIVSDPCASCAVYFAVDCPVHMI